MTKNKIYNGYAFSENEREKMYSNNEAYKELKEKYKVLKVSDFNFETPTKEQLEENDIVYSRKGCYGHGEYKLYKAPKDITTLELLLIFDDGNLCFGGSQMSSDMYRVSED